MKKFLEICEKFLSLLSFLTVLPLGIRGELDKGAEGFYMIPLVGMIVGFISGIPELITGIHPLVRGILVTSLLYALSGLIHLDGFADFIDASSAGLTGNEALKVMKEPLRGAKAISATALIILLTYAGASGLPNGLKGLCLVAGLTTINYESLFLTATIAKPSYYEGLGRLFIAHSKSNFLRIINGLLTAIVLMPLVLYGGPVLLTAIITSLGITALTIWYTLIRAYKILGFVNGDILGYELELLRSISFISVAVILGFLQ